MTHDDTFENLQKKIGKKLELDESDMAIDLHHHKGEKLDDYKGQIMYKWIAAESELQEKIVLVCQLLAESQLKFYPTIHFWSTIHFHFQLQFTYRIRA